jgi:molybdopterin-guanine dinucleotide biosynthesis protein A
MHSVICACNEQGAFCLFTNRQFGGFFMQKIDKHNISMAIIAGGKSKRFGKPKALAECCGKPLVHYPIAIAKELAVPTFIVNGQIIKYDHLGIQVIPDLIPDCGPIGGLYTALKHTSTEFVATIPVDMPLLPPEIYLTLFNHIDLGKPVVAQTTADIEPLVSIWPKSSTGYIKMCIDEKRYSLRIPIKELDATLINMEDVYPDFKETFFLNVNYQKDLEMIKKHRAGQ